ncbi:hypothetical protein FHK04_12435 [Trichococcus shcherbakoviae subsp. psychrophilus]|uniref:Beta-galactosidase n=2 Tax=Trichococcus shcherbakoviae TaxID=2094020 RepID=A0A5C5E536_9LACT|nr:hypothetical protein FHK04_12435 [Trichococcus shcherbakoviae subsp. psychrophilus]
MMNKPHFKKINNIPTLIVNDKPFLALAGELHNSSASSDRYMSANVWENINRMNVNTVVAPVYWEMIEEHEGEFDFSSVRSLIEQARQNNKKLILLWFGLWKNGLSTYIPKWMKKDQERYPFVRKSNGEKLYSVTPLCDEAIVQDSAAFRQLMRFLKAFDQEDQTVIMVQIENEVGTLGTDFDYSEEALQKVSEQVPEVVERFASKKGNWLECFGKDAKEYFMAYHYATAVDSIASIGKEEYALPFFVNAWLEKYPARPGDYPTGGPTARMAPFWEKVTTNIEAFAPDIYVPNFSEVCEQFLSFQDNLLIPETRQDIQTVANLFYGIAKYNINCYSPFGIEDFFKEESKQDQNVLVTLAIDASAFRYAGTGIPLSKAYEILSGMSPLILKYRGTDKMFPFMKEKESDRGMLYGLENCEAKITYQNFQDGKIKSSGFLIETGNNELYFVGVNASLTLKAGYGENYQVGVLSLEEGSFVDGIWQRGRILNGDERYYISVDNEPKVYRIEYHQY